MNYPIKTESNLLIVEPNAEKRELLVAYFSKAHNCDQADSVGEAVEKIRNNRYSAVLAPILPPDHSGLRLIAILDRYSPNTVPIFLSEVDSAGCTVKAYRAGAFDVVQMPTSLNRIEASVEKALVQYEMRTLRDNYKRQVEDEVFRRTAELELSLEEVESSYRSTLTAIVRALEERELESDGHSERMVTFSLRLGYELGLGGEAMRDLELGTLLHDIGKIGVPDSILHKPERLSEAEWNKIKLHPVLGHHIISNIPFLDRAARIVVQHHECWDGSGYPFNLRGEEIEIGARILSVVDAFDAMISGRVYQQRQSYEAVSKEIESFSGTQFDPTVVEAFKNVPEEDWEILRERSLSDRKESQSFRAIVSKLVYAERSLELVH